MQMNQINLDINKAGQIINEPVVLRVGEKDQTITVSLLKDGQPYTAFTTATFYANKPSGSIVANDPANISGGTITYTVPQALVNEFGKITNAYFLIDGKTSTESFVIAVLQGVRISDDLNDYIPGMSNLNVIYDKWKTKLDSITKEMAGIDAPKEVQNVVNNVLKDYANQLNDLKGKLNTLQSDVNNLKVPEIGGRNLLLGTSSAKVRNSTWKNHIKVDITNLVGKILTYSAVLDITDCTQGSAAFYLTPQDSSGNPIGDSVWSNFINFGNAGKAVATVTIPAGASTLDITEQTYNTDLNPTVGSRKLEQGSIATDWTPAPEDKVNVSDTANWQKQKIFQDGNFMYASCPSGTDFGNFLMSDSVPVGFSIIRDQHTNWNWRIIKESSLWVYGIAQDAIGTVYHLEVNNGTYAGSNAVMSNLMGKTITATDDTGKTVNLKITGIS